MIDVSVTDSNMPLDGWKPVSLVRESAQLEGFAVIITTEAPRNCGRGLALSRRRIRMP